jgi:hypothetical protein
MEQSNHDLVFEGSCSGSYFDFDFDFPTFYFLGGGGGCKRERKRGKRERERVNLRVMERKGSGPRYINSDFLLK